MNDLGTRLKEARTRKGLSQTDLANATGVHYSQVGRYENKGATPSAEVLGRIANELGVTADFLLNGTRADLADGTLADKDLLNQFKQIESMTPADRDVIKTLLDAFITKKKVQQLAR